MAPLSVVQPTKFQVLAKVLEAPAMDKVLATVPDKVCRRSPKNQMQSPRTPKNPSMSSNPKHQRRKHKSPVTPTPLP